MKCKCKRLGKEQMLQLGMGGGFSGVINVFIGNASFGLLGECKNSVTTEEEHPNVRAE